jgi:CheY-like chemotaxis protein
MLSIILSYSDILLSETDPNDEKFALLSEVKLAGERSADLTRQLLAFSQQRPLETKVVAIDGIVESTSRMIRLVVGEDVALTTHLATEGSFARVAPGQIEQVLMNLVVNARDAMPVGGKLTIETAPFELDASSPVTHPDMLPGRYLMLAVSDSGSGMDARTVERIFEPFFTTKEQGRGTGLGLSTVFGIVRQVGGQIYVYSELGKGTTFKLYFPEHRGPDQETADVGPQVSAAPSSETVLLVEDDAQVRKLAHEVLRRRGYHVLSAEHPGEALLVCDGYEGPIDLLLTDVIMPQMSGRQLADRLVVARPDMKVLYVSGYTANVVLDHGVGQTTAFLQKPFTPDSLSRTVRSVLDSHALPAVAP